MQWHLMELFSRYAELSSLMLFSIAFDHFYISKTQLYNFLSET